MIPGPPELGKIIRNGVVTFLDLFLFTTICLCSRSKSVTGIEFLK